MSSRLTCSEPIAKKTAFNRKAVALISGGLDSTLAIYLVKRQGIDVTAIHFTSFFCVGEPEADDSPVRITARQLDVPLVFIPRGKDFIQILRDPQYGFGKNANPCIDCRIYSLVKAREFMEQIGASFLVTGEVAGQRPMSQRRHTLRLIEKKAECEGIVLRPLSAKILPVTGPEEAGVVDRNLLLDVAGRGRKVQLSLARQFNLTGYSAPAGGCLLTDKNFSRRVRDLLGDSDIVSPEDLEALRIGRHFRIRPGLKVIVGRDESENNRLESLASGKMLFAPVDFPGPVVLALGRPDSEEKALIGSLIRRYAKPTNRGDAVSVEGPEADTEIIHIAELPSDDWMAEHLI